MRTIVTIVVALLALARLPLSACGQEAADSQPAAAANRHYGLRYDLMLHPAEDRADVSLSLDDRIEGNIRSFKFHVDPLRHTGFKGDGEIKDEGDYVTWTPPPQGGKFSFSAKVSNKRPNGHYDARMTEDWAIFRGDDLFPPAQTDQHDEAEADAYLHVHTPQVWSFITAYPSAGKYEFEIEHSHRSFDRPTGWMIAGHVGVRRELIDGVRVIVAGPMGQSIRRLDLIAMLNWNLPELKRVVPDMPERVLIVSAQGDMWRGGLSGPNSLFIHADRPLISENGTSTLVHEMMHVANRIEGEPGADWIVEGIAEYYSLKLMWRSDTITYHRYRQSLEKLSEWGKEAPQLDVDFSGGPVTARAVGVMRRLDREIYAKTSREKTLDDVVRLLSAAGEKVNLKRFRAAVEQVMGAPADALSDEQLGLGERLAEEPATGD